jgi:hypothetical protein
VWEKRSKIKYDNMVGDCKGAREYEEREHCVNSGEEIWGIGNWLKR